MQQALGNGVALVLAQVAQRLQQRLQGLWQAFAARQGVQHGIQYLLPCGVNVVGGGQQGHGELLRALDIAAVHGLQFYGACSRMLCIHNLGCKLQIVGNGIAVSQLTQTRSTFRKQCGDLW